MNEAEAKDALIDVMRENETLRLQLNGMTSMKDALTDEAEKLRAELAAIKPDWKDAPEWATTWYIECGWAGGKHPNEEPYYMNTELRPEES